MSKVEKLEKVIKYIMILTIGSGIIGLIIFLVFLYLISKKYSVTGGSEIDLVATSQVGDFIGGIVGSIWAVTAILIFYLALLQNRKEFILHREEFKLQREELNLQKEELKKQNLEFQLNRITNIAYKQIEICEISINHFTIMDPDNNLKIRGREAITWLINEIILYLPVKSNEVYDFEEEGLDFNTIYLHQWLQGNLKEIMKVTDTVYNSCLLIELILAKNIDIDNNLKNEVKTLYLANLGRDVDTFFTFLFQVMVENTFINVDSFLLEQIKHIYKYQKFSYSNAITINN